MRVLVTGGAGYVGSVLVPMLGQRGHDVVVYDTVWFGSHLDAQPGLHIAVRDVRDEISFAGFVAHCDAVIHLAAVSNDESVNQQQQLSREVNLDCLPMLLRRARLAGVQRFIFASTSAVYGDSPTPRVEDDLLYPHFNYAKWKAEAEPIVLQEDRMCTTVARPAAIFGHSPRMRFDLGVNILTACGAINKLVEVWGGEQMRSCLHVKDMADAYCQLLEAPMDTIDKQVYNVGASNWSITQIAKKVAELTEADIWKKDARDPRSYQIASFKWGQQFKAPKIRVEQGIKEMMGKIRDGCYSDPLGNPVYHNTRWMKEKNFA